MLRSRICSGSGGLRRWRRSSERFECRSNNLASALFGKGPTIIESLVHMPVRTSGAVAREFRAGRLEVE